MHTHTYTLILAQVLKTQITMIQKQWAVSLVIAYGDLFSSSVYVVMHGLTYSFYHPRGLPIWVINNRLFCKMYIRM